MPYEYIQENLKKYFGYDSFKTAQLNVIKSILDKNDTLAIMPTGGGKSLCYQLPAMLLDGVCVVVSPLIALMKDQVDALERRGIKSAFINSSQTSAEQKQAMQSLACGDIKIIYVAPERFRSEWFVSTLRNIKISLFAVDEAHCISQWGHDFRPDYMRLGDAIKRLGKPLVAAFTATATPEVKEDICRQLNLLQANVFVSGFARENLSFNIRKVRSNAEKNEIILKNIRERKAGIIYCATRKTVEKVSEILSAEGVSHACYHGGMSAEERDSMQDKFVGKSLDVAVATNAFGMGIDRADIRFVCHYELPGSIEAYYQEAGRAGRDGLPSQCDMLFSYADKRVQEFFIEGSNPSLETIRKLYSILRKNAGEDGVLKMSIEDMESALTGSKKSSAISGMSISSAISILRRFGYIERIDEAGSRIRSTRVNDITLPPQEIVFPDGLLEEKKLRDEAKLKAVLRIAYSDECRQKWILNYFGETQAENCGICDICANSVGQNFSDLSADELTEVRKALSAAARISYRRGARQWQGRFGKALLVKSLLGSKDEKILKASLDKLSTYGILKNHGKAFVAALVDSLLSAKLLEIEDGEYPLVNISDSGVRIMLGEESSLNLNYPRELSKLFKSSKPDKKKGKAKKAELFESEAALADIDEGLLKKLVSQRNRLMFLRGNVPAYTIFPNSVLQSLAIKRPKNAEDAMSIKGVGPQKAKTILPSFLKIISEHEA